MHCHQMKNIRTLLRGDVFVLSGHQQGLEWLLDKMNEVQSQQEIGARENEDMEEKVPNRTIV